ncbi:MAG: aminopeptidase P family protein [Erysipelotrichia bacterium]|jgi:Xaa-Pro aminopeptidase|nr:aminopeptidase P family protein [Erysipelotrichia bacterium]
MLPKVKKIQRLMKELGVDVLLAQSPENFAYVSGFSSHQHTVSRHPQFAAAFVLPEGKSTLIGMDFETPSFNHEDFHVLSFTTWVGNRTQEELHNLHFKKEMITLLDHLDHLIQSSHLSASRIGVELDYLPQSYFELMNKRWPQAEFVNVSQDFIKARMIKEVDEIQWFKTLISISDHALNVVANTLQEGMSELDLYHIYTTEVMKSNVAYPSTWSSFGSGVNGGKLGYSSDKIITSRDVVKFDGGVHGGTSFYTTDFSRSWLMSEVDPWLVEVKRNLMEAHELMLRAMKPGLSFKELFNIGYQHTLAKYPFYVRGHLGHSISMGPQTAEVPFISSNQEGVLEEGMILSVENPMYITGYNGFNIEDMVLVTRDGIEILTPLTPHYLPSEAKYR